MKKTVGVIPARWGSTRFPGKLLHPIAGQPLLQHVWERCQQAQSLDAVIIATDDMRIAQAAFDWGAEVSLTSSQHASGTDRVAEVARNLRGVTHIVNVQGDEPLIDPKLIDRLAAALRHDRTLEMITAAHPFTALSEVMSPHQNKVVLDQKGNSLYFSRSPIPFLRDSAAPFTYLRHQGIYGYRRDFLLRFVRWRRTPLERAESLEQLRALENGVRIHVVVTESGSPGVDTPEDARAIEQKLLASPGRTARRRRPQHR